MNWLQRLFCRHKDTTFVRNIYGDEIIDCGYKRSIWRCTNCGKLVLQDELHETQGAQT